MGACASVPIDLKNAKVPEPTKEETDPAFASNVQEEQVKTEEAPKDEKAVTGSDEAAVKEEEKAEQVSTPTAPKEEEKTPSDAQEAKGQPATDATGQEDEKPAAVKEAEKSTQ